MQEIDRYNLLFETVLRTLGALQLGIQGLSVITPELEQIFAGLLNAQVPQAWAFAYPSLKPLASWMRYVVPAVPCLLVHGQVWCRCSHVSLTEGFIFDFFFFFMFDLYVFWFFLFSFFDIDKWCF